MTACPLACLWRRIRAPRLTERGEGALGARDHGRRSEAHPKVTRCFLPDRTSRPQHTAWAVTDTEKRFLGEMKRPRGQHLACAPVKEKQVFRSTVNPGGGLVGPWKSWPSLAGCSSTPSATQRGHIDVPSGTLCTSVVRVRRALPSAGTEVDTGNCGHDAARIKAEIRTGGLGGGEGKHTCREAEIPPQGTPSRPRQREPPGDRRILVPTASPANVLLCPAAFTDHRRCLCGRGPRCGQC